MEKRKVVIAGNWKMNKTPREAARFIDELKYRLKQSDAKIILCVPSIDIAIACRAIQRTELDLYLAAQNCHWAESGAFTGEISADMLKGYDVKYSIVGHSERRQYFGETDETVNKRALACHNAGITPIICVGENLSQREAGETQNIVKIQVEKAVNGFTVENMKNSIIAYEPVWAIGTGKTATAEQAQEVCSFIRKTIKDMFGEETAQEVIIQYGGSMNRKNARELLSMEDIDGGLVGGASLKVDEFIEIIKNVK